jgi:hypothetical protein
MSISALNWAFGMRGVSVSQKVVLISLANFSDENGYSFPSIKTIAEISCMSTASVRRALSDLCSDGILRVEHRFRADGSQTSSGYFLELTPPVNLTPPPLRMTPPPVTGDTPYNHHITTTLIDTPYGVSLDDFSKEPEKPPPKRSAEARGARLPDGWTPTHELNATGLELGLSQQEIENETAKFRDYWTAQPGAKGRKLDWPATWRNWLRTAAERRRGKAVQSNAYSNQPQSSGRAAAAIRRYKARQGDGSGW